MNKTIGTPQYNRPNCPYPKDRETAQQQECDQDPFGPSCSCHLSPPLKVGGDRRSSGDYRNDRQHQQHSQRAGTMWGVGSISPAEAMAALRKYRDALAARLQHVQAGWERQRPLPYFVDAMFDHSITMIKAELTWIEKFIRH
jgi:hypothetical protein